MNKKNVFCTLCLIFSPLTQASDSASANITLHIPERANIESVSRNAHTAEYGAVGSAFFCVGETSGLQFSIVSENSLSLSSIDVDVDSAPATRSKALDNNNVNECHERNSGVLKITQLPQGTRTITAVVVTE